MSTPRTIPRQMQPGNGETRHAYHLMKQRIESERAAKADLATLRARMADSIYTLTEPTERAKR